MEQNFILYREENQVAILELDDPSANTLTFDLLKELEARVFEIALNPSIRGIILTGKGDKFFSGGVNIGMLLTAGRQHNSHFILYAAEVLEFIESLPLPVVTLINGNITGGGLELALIADYRIAVDGSYNIGFPEVRLGVIPGMGGTQRLARLVGPQIALEMITQGEFVTPAKAKAIGLVDRIMSSDNFFQQAVNVATDYICTHNPHENRQHERELQAIQHNQLLALNIEDGIAKIVINAEAELASSIDILFALNEHLLEVRTDDSIYCLLIEVNASKLGQGLGVNLCHGQRIAQHILKKISGYPRVVAMDVKAPLDELGFELALHCDYRFISYSPASSHLAQKINTDSPQLARYTHLLPPGSETISVAELTESGFFKVVADPITWLARFVPPLGAGQAIGYAKLAIAQGYKEPLTSSLLLERHLQEQLFIAHDSKEGMRAYVEKRKPFFTGF